MSNILGNLEMTIEKLLLTMKWRKEFNVDDFPIKSNLEKTPLTVLEPKIIGLNSTLGSPVWYLPIGKIDFKGI